MAEKKEHSGLFGKIIKVVSPFILTGLFLYLAFRDIDLEQAFKYISEADVGGIAIFVGLFVASHILRAIRWKVIIDSVKNDASLLNLFGATMIGYGVNCVVPRLGEVYRAFFLGKWEDISRGSMLGTVIVERIIDVSALGIAVLIAVITYQGDLYQQVPWLESTLVIGFGAILLITLLLILSVRHKARFYNFLLRTTARISKRAAEKTTYIFDMLTEGFATINNRRSLWLSVLLTVIIMLVYGATTFAGFLMLGMNQFQDVTYSMAWIVMSISAFGIIIPTPGGTGSYHALNIFVLTIIFSFPNEISAAYAILTHIISYIIFIVSPTVFVYLINFLRRKKGLPTVNFMTVFKSGVDA